jgi:uncharacterized protein
MTKYEYITSTEDLAAIYSVTPTLASTAKEADHLTPQYRTLLEASPFMILATAGPEGLDCSPRGDAHGLVRIADERTLIIPDRRGNNRIDSLRNIVRDPRIALLFLIPGSGTTLRINGIASITADAGLLASLAVDGKVPRSALVVTIETVYFQCARAILRAGLWDPDKFVSAKDIPSPGEILAALSNGEIEGKKYDMEWPERAAQSMW